MAQFSFSSFVIGDARQYRFSSPVELEMLAEDPFFEELVQTQAFKRLASVRFLGGIDYILVRNPNGAVGNIRYTRLQHSLGVARLALKYCSMCEVAQDDRRLLVAAALLHDIGHAPLSHSVEPAFEEQFGINHHLATKDIIFGRAQIGLSLHNVLRSYSIDIESLDSLISGRDSRFHSFFSGPINFDTIEGILRTRTFGKVPAAFQPDAVVEAAVRRATPEDMRIVDRFWSYKDQVYRHVINSRAGILADQACQMFMRRNVSKLRSSDYFTTEETLFRKLPGLRELLTSNRFASEVLAYVPETLPFFARRFHVDTAASFFERKDKARYFQTKRATTLNVARRREAIEETSRSDRANNESH